VVSFHFGLTAYADGGSRFVRTLSAQRASCVVNVVTYEIVIDAFCPSRLAAFWAQALTGYAVRAYDDKEIARLASLGYSPETDPSVPIDGGGPTIWFQRCDSPATQRNRLHFDIKSNGRGAEVQRLLSLGATVRETRPDHTVLLDPEGNQFCVF
jgi:hypothetical protein